jgi:predicted GH43/DUF377 family glycosyl hydrolase
VALFERDLSNPILAPSPSVWWEAKGVLNPGVVRYGNEIIMLYRAVGGDGISRFGLARSTDGRHFDRQEKPWAETAPGDWDGRLGIEDPRIVCIGGVFYISYCKVGVGPATAERLWWENAPFHIRPWIARTEDFSVMREIGSVRGDQIAKDLVLFPERIGGKFVAMIREFPSIQIIRSSDLVNWDPPTAIIEPIPDSWEADRVGAGPPPLRVPGGWLVIYHANEYLRLPENQRIYRLGLALLDSDDPTMVKYRHPEPIFTPEAPYECSGPVGNVVFATGLIETDGELALYYGAGDGVIGRATTRTADLLALIPTGF